MVCSVAETQMRKMDERDIGIKSGGWPGVGRERRENTKASDEAARRAGYGARIRIQFLRWETGEGITLESIERGWRPRERLPN